MSFTKVVLWYADMTKTKFLTDNGKGALATGGINSAWEEIATLYFPKKFQNDLELCEFLFSGTNDGSLLGDPLHQDMIAKSKARHTSLSVTDIVEVIKSDEHSEFYMCLPAGFEKVTVR